MVSTPQTRSERTARLCAEVALFMRDQVLSRVSHDLRSPLNAIHSWAYVLERKIDNADTAAQRALGGIRTGVEQQVQLIETLIDSTRAETRKLRIARAPFEPTVLIPEAADDARIALGDARGVSIAVEDATGAAMLDGDRERIAQALWLMLVFAAETSPQGASVALTAGATATAAQFAVKWQASPRLLTDETLAHVLERFARAQASEQQEAGRYAWVLALCQRVAEAHGGRFEAPSVLGEGEAVTLALNVPLNGA
jgi:K+-sensing histidine kinase KdpD